MHTSYPKREFTEADMTKTLRDLQLAPSASLLIIPVRFHFVANCGLASTILMTKEIKKRCARAVAVP